MKYQEHSCPGCSLTDRRSSDFRRDKLLSAGTSHSLDHRRRASLRRWEESSCSEGAGRQKHCLTGRYWELFGATPKEGKGEILNDRLSVPLVGGQPQPAAVSMYSRSCYLQPSGVLGRKVVLGQSPWDKNLL